MTLEEIAAKREHYEEIGLQAIYDCKVGAVLLAGGQGTRLGLDKPKGMLNVGVTKELYLFEQLIHNLMQVKEKANAMTIRHSFSKNTIILVITKIMYSFLFRKWHRQ